MLCLPESGRESGYEVYNGKAHGSVCVGKGGERGDSCRGKKNPKQHQIKRCRKTKMVEKGNSPLGSKGGEGGNVEVKKKGD